MSDEKLTPAERKNIQKGLAKLFSDIEGRPTTLATQVITLETARKLSEKSKN